MGLLTPRDDPNLPTTALKRWLLTALKERLIKILTKVVTHSRYVILKMPEAAEERELSPAILDSIQRFGVPPPLVRRG